MRNKKKKKKLNYIENTDNLNSTKLYLVQREIPKI